jgi:hypothetical protein
MTARTEKTDEAWLRRHYPTRHAREAADVAIDALPNEATMAAHIDAWIAAYRAAGGMVRT